MNGRNSRSIVTIGTGGTISAVADALGRSGSGLSSRDIAASVSGIADGVTVRSVDFSKIPGRAMRPADMIELAGLIQQQVAGGDCDGVVVTHGTDTLEETAFALATTLDVSVPVVVTGAMRLPKEAGHDGPGNVKTAVTVAADPAAAALGPLVAFHDELHLPRWVAKTHTSHLAAFRSPDGPLAGSVTEGRVSLTGISRPPDLLGLPQSVDQVRVELIWIAAGADGYLLERAAEHAQGIVVAGTGGGHTPPPVADAIERVVAAGTPVVVASRCGAGPVLRQTYAGKGGEEHLRSIGAIPAGRLHPVKARLRLQIALALGRRAGEVFPT